MHDAYEAIYFLDEFAYQTRVSDMLKDAFNAALIAFCIFAGTWLLAWMLSVGWFSWLY